MIKKEIREIKEEVKKTCRNVNRIRNYHKNLNEARSITIERIDEVTEEVKNIMIHYIDGEFDEHELERQLKWKYTDIMFSLNQNLKIQKELEEKEIERKKLYN